MLLKKLKIVILASVLAIFWNCSTENEILEEQGPQSEISASLNETLQESMAFSVFEPQINWYQNINPQSCGVDAMLLAYELFDSNGVSLNVISIFNWEASQGSLSGIVNEMIDFHSNEFQQDVTLIFVSGILIKNVNNEDLIEFAQVNSYTLFLDYFDNCQSNQVVFQPFPEGDIDWLFMDIPASETPVEFPSESCLSLVFPVNVLMVGNNLNETPFQVTINNELEFIEYFTNQSTTFTVLDFVYPISFISSNGDLFTANNIQQVEQLFNQNCN